MRRAEWGKSIPSYMCCVLCIYAIALDMHGERDYTKICELFGEFCQQIYKYFKKWREKICDESSVRLTVTVKWSLEKKLSRVIHFHNNNRRKFPFEQTLNNLLNA